MPLPDCVSEVSFDTPVVCSFVSRDRLIPCMFYVWFDGINLIP